MVIPELGGSPATESSLALEAAKGSPFCQDSRDSGGRAAASFGSSVETCSAQPATHARVLVPFQQGVPDDQQRVPSRETVGDGFVLARSLGSHAVKYNSMNTV